MSDKPATVAQALLETRQRSEKAKQIWTCTDGTEFAYPDPKDKTKTYEEVRAAVMKHEGILTKQERIEKQKAWEEIQKLENAENKNS